MLKAFSGRIQAGSIRNSRQPLGDWAQA